jgi:hypothetical protein
VVPSEWKRESNADGRLSARFATRSARGAAQSQYEKSDFCRCHRSASLSLMLPAGPAGAAGAAGARLMLIGGRAQARMLFPKIPPKWKAGGSVATPKILRISILMSFAEKMIGSAAQSDALASQQRTNKRAWTSREMCGMTGALQHPEVVSSSQLRASHACAPTTMHVGHQELQLMLEHALCLSKRGEIDKSVAWCYKLSPRA